MISDRMTPEFKLNNEDLMRVGNFKDSRSNSGNFPIIPFDDNDLSPRMESLLLGIQSSRRNSTRRNSGKNGLSNGKRNRLDSLNFPLGLLQSPPIEHVKNPFSPDEVSPNNLQQLRNTIQIN